MKILAGFYYGIGDFIAVLPALKKLSENKDTELYVAVGESIQQIEKLLNTNNISFIYFPLFSLSKMAKLFKFIHEIQRIHPHMVTLSPHVADKATSWKIPLLLSLLKKIGFIKTIVGSQSDHNALFYTKKIDSDKSLPLQLREIDFFTKLNLLENVTSLSDPIFTLHASTQKKNEIVIHPGASKQLKLWSTENYVLLCQLILQHYPEYTIRFIGLTHELERIQNNINTSTLFFETSDLATCIASLLHVKTIITVDSAFTHIAAALNIPNIAIFGATNPKFYAPQNTSIQLLYKHALHCQYCDALHCIYTNNICMDLITPQDVLNRLHFILENEQI